MRERLGSGGTGGPIHHPLRFLLTLSLACGAAAAQTNVLSQHNDNDRTGAQLTETTLTPANVNAKHFGLLVKLPVDDQIYGQPLFVSAVRVNGGAHDLVFVTTVNNSVYAFDGNAGASTKPVWHVNFGMPANLYDAAFGCLDINGSMGIIGTPVISLERNALYVVALTRTSAGFQQRLHALDLATGGDLPGSPAPITAPAFDPLMQNQRPGLALANNTVYIGYASHCDKEPYHGFLLAYDAATLQQTAVLNTSPTGEGASIWHSGQAPAVDAQGNVYVVTGNGSWDGTHNFSESFLKLDPRLRVLDWFTPSNHVALDKADNDLDSSGATLIPGTNRVLGGGKEGVLYALDQSGLGKLGDEHALQHFQATKSHLHSLVYWKSDSKSALLYVWGQRDKPRVYAMKNGGEIVQEPVMTRPEANEGHPGAMLSLSAHGGRDGILWAAIHATGDSWHESRPGILHAYDAEDITHELWNSWQNRTRDDCDGYSKMAPPTIANGKVYLASFGKENIGTGQLCIYGLLPSGSPPPAPGPIEGSVAEGKVSLQWPATEHATSYTVLSSASTAGPFLPLASGLITPSLTEVPFRGKAMSFRVTARGADGESKPSSVITVNALPAVAERHMH